MKKLRSRKQELPVVRALSPDQLARIEGAGGQGVETLTAEQLRRVDGGGGQPATPTIAVIIIAAVA